jgi:hypothetical protein
MALPKPLTDEKQPLIVNVTTLDKFAELLVNKFFSVIPLCARTMAVIVGATVINEAATALSKTPI